MTATAAPIEAYTFVTPNGQKLLIALEELGLPYSTNWVHIGKGEQMRPEFLRINPNHKIPAIVDPAGPGGAPVTLFESGAILLYLADKAGALGAAPGTPARYQLYKQLFFQAAGTGPMFGQLGYFRKFAPNRIPPAIERYAKEAERLLGVLDGMLGAGPYLLGGYSIADIMQWPWVNQAPGLGIELGNFPNVARWHAAIAARPAVVRAMALKP